MKIFSNKTQMVATNFFVQQEIAERIQLAYVQWFQENPAPEGFTVSGLHGDLTLTVPNTDAGAEYLTKMTLALKKITEEIK